MAEEEAVKTGGKAWRKVLAAAFLVLITLAALEVYAIFYGPNTFSTAQDKVLFVSRGQTFASIVDSLQTQGIIRSRELFILVARLRGVGKRIRVGKYVFPSGISNMGICNAMSDGKGMKLIAVTIPEGKLARVQAKIFARVIGIDSARYMNLVHDEEFVHALGVDGTSLEGFLLPETYNFNWQQDEKDIVRRQVGSFWQFYNDSLKEKAGEYHWTTKQVLTLASIVEGEAVLNEERPIISGVYHNRLRKGMRLEADPTIQYIIENAPRRVLYSDLRLDNPYNTYRNEGLPPGPINSPGKASILAALYPAMNNYIYFVANGKGGHWFSSNYEDHMRNVRKYRRERARNRLQARRDSTRESLVARKNSSPAN